MDNTYLWNKMDMSRVETFCWLQLSHYLGNLAQKFSDVTGMALCYGSIYSMFTFLFVSTGIDGVRVAVVLQSFKSDPLFFSLLSFLSYVYCDAILTYIGRLNMILDHAL